MIIATRNDVVFNLSIFTQPITAGDSSRLESFGLLVLSLKATSSKNDKQSLLADALNGQNSEFFSDLLCRALSPLHTHGIKKLPEYSPTETPVLLPHQREGLLLSLLDSLACRSLTGNAAKEQIAETLGKLTPVEAEIARKLILKDLDAGFSESTVNKAKSDTVPSFDIQGGVTAVLGKVSYPAFAEAKYDGVRCVIVKRAGKVDLRSRNGLPFDNFAELAEAAVEAMPDNAVFDGEILHRTELGVSGYKKVMKRVSSDFPKHNDIPIRFMVFDYMSIDDWDTKLSLPLNSRRTLASLAVEATRKKLDDQGMFCLGHAELVRDEDGLLATYNQLIEDGFEGAMIKPVSSLYTFKKNATWMKLKPFETADLRVVGLYEGEKKYTGMMGGFILEGDHEGKPIRTECGTGISDELRKEYWHNQNSTIGRIAEVRFQDVTQAENSDTFSLRFPSFVRWRAENDGGKI